MLEQLLNMVKDNSQDAIVNNPAIPNQFNDSAQSSIMESIMGGLQNEVQGGNIGGLLGLLTGKQAAGSGLMSNPIVAGIAQNAIGSLMDKFGVENAAAKGIVASVLPGVINSLITKTNDPNDSSIDMNSVFGSLMGGQAQPQQQGFDFNQIGAALSDGKLDMNDVMNIGGSLLQGNSGGGGLGGLLGGLFGGNR